MKRILVLCLAVLMLLSFATVASAADYGVIYDETEQLYTDELNRLGTEVLPAFTEKYGIDLRVDVLTSMSGHESIEACAAYIYEQYEYGANTDGHGVSLTILLSEDETGYALDEWCAHFGGDSEELTTNGPWNIPKVYDLMTEEAWSGDAVQDALVLEGAVGYFAEGLEQFVLAGGVAGSIYMPEMPEDPQTQQQEQPQEPQSESPLTDFVIDSAGLLSAEQKQTLEQTAASIAETYDFGVYIVTVGDFASTGASSVKGAAETVFASYGMGIGTEKDGLLLLLSMADRDYWMMANGAKGLHAFNTEGREALVPYFLDNFGENDWFGGFEDYLYWAGEYLRAAESGTPYSEDNVPMDDVEKAKSAIITYGIAIAIALAISGIVIAVCNAKMKSVAPAVHASAYVSGGLNLTGSMDNYTHTTTTRVKKSSSSSSSGSGSVRSSGSGTGGKF